MIEKLKHSQLQDLILSLFDKVGLPQDKAKITSHILLEGELLGHRTHGLHLMMPYIEHLRNGSMEKVGSYKVLNKTPASQLWDGQYLAGPWLVNSALMAATDMADGYGVGTIVIQKSSHIGCLAAYMQEASQNGHLVILSCSDPDNATVAPFGGTEGVYGPNPLALGIPTSSDPIIIDASMSATSNGLIHQKHQAKEPLEHPWLITPNGEPTKDAETFFDKEPSTILPLGGIDSGYKGFALGIMIEAMTSALGGYGRSSEPDRWGASAFVQVINPQKFSGESYFKREMDFLKKRCLASKPANDVMPVRLPGQRGLELKKKQLLGGITLRPETLAGLNNLASQFEIEF
ncbi:MAG: LDH2 family malate/lactate/ureidoglycolate dehydrogenase [Arcticibacterium sp.]|jgi:LDH2 family malate/lactate/ureidoglycolate dehydrogenase